MKQPKIHLSIAKFCLTAAILSTTTLSYSQLRHSARDKEGRHEVERGFVVITSDSYGEVFYTAMDYNRMAHLGANHQVIRIDPTKLGGNVDREVSDKYLVKLDSLVDMARNVGMKTSLKMTIYGIKGFTWEKFWRNQEGIQDIHLQRWQELWDRYADDEYVVGYDLLNEPRKMSLDVTYPELTNDYLIPYYEQMIDKAVKYSDQKMFYCQSIFVNKGEQEEHMQYAPIEKRIKRKNVVFCPHTYKNKVEDVAPTMQMFDECSKKMDAPMFVGEWGFPTFASADTVVVKQHEYADLYAESAKEFDRLGCGTVKAWFTGTAVSKSRMSGESFTWAMYQDLRSVGSYERKYIVDVIARPYPQLIAGDIYDFGFDFAKRELNVNLKVDNSKGSSHIYISADRHYPDGFTVECGDDIAFCYNPQKNVGFETLRNDGKFEMSNFIWDSAKQQLVILQLPNDKEMLKIRVYPGVN